ncbi:MAG: hypothetical protein DWQ18_03160 [Crenarchaeota archaeon]|nr:MAG: hypothetical protein DWQ17_05370 [Thermoproteota archaeon]RDJ33925.1 MAG: hypothetical protein DWQ18_03160 [Thermoproteota archaeon]RDJ36963.1 MAG: hypothetical protein DWQ13_07460 [Thermoproteota archaeon]RDJ37502.1 MAG: hypothetical protein DWQ19_03375 [Thermoproteota archaeon]
MPDELCRNCGNELQVESWCSECRQPIQQLCGNCNYATLERIHADCALGFEQFSKDITQGHVTSLSTR